MIHYVCQDGNNFIVKDITGKTLQVTFDQFCTMLNGKKGTFLSFLDSTGNIQVYSASKNDDSDFFSMDQYQLSSEILQNKEIWEKLIQLCQIQEGTHSVGPIIDAMSARLSEISRAEFKKWKKNKLQEIFLNYCNMQTLDIYSDHELLLIKNEYVSTNLPHVQSGSLNLTKLFKFVGALVFIEGIAIMGFAPFGIHASAIVGIITAACGVLTPCVFDNATVNKKYLNFKKEIANRTKNLDHEYDTNFLAIDYIADMDVRYLYLLGSSADKSNHGDLLLEYLQLANEYCEAKTREYQHLAYDKVVQKDAKALRDHHLESGRYQNSSHTVDHFYFIKRLLKLDLTVAARKNDFSRYAVYTTEKRGFSYFYQMDMMLSILGFCIHNMSKDVIDNVSYVFECVKEIGSSPYPGCEVDIYALLEAMLDYLKDIQNEKKDKDDKLHSKVKEAIQTSLKRKSGELTSKEMQEKMDAINTYLENMSKGDDTVPQEGTTLSI